MHSFEFYILGQIGSSSVAACAHLISKLLKSNRLAIFDRITAAHLKLISFGQIGSSSIAACSCCTKIAPASELARTIFVQRVHTIFDRMPI